MADRRRAALVSLAATIGSGIIGWSLAFAGLGPWGLVTGGAIVLIVIIVVARRPALRLDSALFLGYAFAFILITWPVLWLAVGWVRYLVTGQSIGN